MNDDLQQKTHSVQHRVMEVLAYLITLGFFGVIGALMTLDMPQASHEVLLVMLGTLGTAFVAVITYYYGSSAGSTFKDNKPEPKKEF